MRCLSILLCVAFAGCATPSVPLSSLVDELAAADVVFLGEDHDNSVGHRQHHQLLRLLHAKRPEIVVSMEMFERDVQGTLDDYLTGNIDEEEFLENARPWPNYKRDYRPFIEFAKENELRVVAANVPRKLAQKFMKEEVGVGRNPDVARSTSSPRDAYWEKFVVAMEEHPGMGEDLIFNAYRAQCLKDDTMAESIVEALSLADDAPLVVHVCGQFHSNEGFGTVARVEERMPGVRCVILSMDTAPNVVRTAPGRYTLVVPPEPEMPEIEVDEEAEPQGRPALGLKPHYDSVDGVEVDEVIEGGNADKAGLRAGDVMLRVGGVDLTDIMSYMEALSSLTIGEKAEVVVDRGGEMKTIEVLVGARGH